MRNAFLDDIALERLHTITGTRLACGKTLVEMTTYAGVAMWWFVDAEFYYSLAVMLNARLGEGLWRHRARSIYDRMEFLTQVFENFLVRAILRLYETKPSPSRGAERIPKILFTAQDWQWRVIRDQETGFTKKSDAFFDSILTKFLGKSEFVGVDPLTPLHPVLLRAQIPKWKILIDKLRNWSIPQKPTELYWSLNAWRTERAASKHFKGVWHILQSDSEFRVICARAGGGAGDSVVESQLGYYFHVAFPRAVRYIQMANRMIKKEKPDLILLLNEYGLFERATVIAAKQLGVPTVAIQHGVIHAKHRGYMHSRHEISPDGGSESPYCPIPDATAVFGPFYKRLLTKLSTYPEDRVFITGQPRYDRIYHIEKLYSRERFLREHSIDPNNKMVLWTTQCHGLSMEENHRNFVTVLKTMRRFENVRLVIKQHPGEGPIYTRMIQNYLANYGVGAVITRGDSDVYEQLYACDLMVAKSSTTIMEAVALDKPVIVLNLTAEPPPIGLDYVKEGVAIEVSGEEELNSAIQGLLTSDRKLARNRKRFVEKYLYRLDGRATNRVINLISKAMRNTENEHSSLYA